MSNNQNSSEIECLARQLASEIRHNFFVHTHPKYGLQLIYALWQAKLCGYQKVTAVEFGVASGRGLSALENYAQDFSSKFDIEVIVQGFDTGRGLPSPQDYRDHPEIWTGGDYSARYTGPVIYGDIKNTLPQYIENWGDSVLGFVSLDLDLYSSTINAMPIFEMSPDQYLPSVMVHLDDTNTQLTMNPWCGAELAVNEFNNTHTMRKFEQKHHCWNIDNFYVMHVLDHDMRSGVVKPAMPINCSPF